MKQDLLETDLLEINKQLVEKAKSFVPRLRERGSETEELRRVPEDIIQDLKDEGLFKILRPTRYGGHQSNIRTYLDCLVEISRGCGSTGWVYSLCNIRELMIAESFTEETHKEIYGPGTDVVFAGVFEPREIKVRRVEGGYFIDEGRWMFCSGSVHATWGYFGMPLVDETGAVVDHGLITLPFKDIEIGDDWNTLGMRGTSSHGVIIRNTFIPDRRAVSLSEAKNGNFQSKHFRDQSLYNTALFPALNLSLSAPALGLARAALDIFMERLPNRRISYTFYDKQDEAPVTHLQLSEAALKIDSAAMHFYRVADELDAFAESGKYMDADTRIKVNGDMGIAVEYCKEALNILIGASGGSYIYNGNPLQRVFRDFWSMYVHGAILPSSQLETYGRSLCGLEPNKDFI